MPHAGIDATVIAKHVCGRRTAHTGDGCFTLSWRLWSDGRLERTNGRSKYQRYIVGECVPAALLSAAKCNGVSVLPGREVWRPPVSHPRGCRCPN